MARSLPANAAPQAANACHHGASPLLSDMSARIEHNANDFHPRRLMHRSRPATGRSPFPLHGLPIVFERYYRELLNFLARAVRDRDVAADLTQESFTRVLAVQRAGQEIHDPRALLYRTARNLVIDQHRQAEVRGASVHGAGHAEDGDELSEVPGPRTQQPEVVLSSRQDLAAIVATIEKLPPRCREAFVLFKFDGMSYAEIAQHMGISVRTVEMQLQIAMRACWETLDDLQ